MAWRWISLLWLALGVVAATQTVVSMHSAGMHHDWVLLFTVTLARWLPWVPATIGILFLERVLPLFGPRRAFAWTAHVAAVALIALAMATWVALLTVWFNPFGDSPPPQFAAAWTDAFNSNALSTVVQYAIVLMIQHAIASRERDAVQAAQVAQLNERLAQAQLNALRHQIEPHFLFNALNAISGLIREGRPDAAVEMVIALSEFLRRTLNGLPRQEVPLHEEVEFTRQYLAIQKVRYGGRLHFDIDVPDDLGGAAVPNLILQPLVENAVVHGIAKRAAAGVIHVAAARDDGTLILRVSNDGPPLPHKRDAIGTGIGIANVRQRLEGLYGAASSFALRDRSAGGVEASISLPLRRAETV